MYGVTRYDDENDKGDADLWMVATAGGKPRRLTSMKGNESEPAWSPDGQWIAFVAKRGDDKQSQLYVIARDGGEATRVGDMPTGVVGAEVVPGFRGASPSSRASGRTITDWEKTRRAHEGARGIEDEGA